MLNVLHDKFPNLKIAYLSNRIYGGNAAGPLNPEPYAYASGFSAKWVISSQIEGKPGSRSLGGRIEGAHTWKGDLEAGRQDGCVPSGLLMDFLQNDPPSRPWFVK